MGMTLAETLPKEELITLYWKDEKSCRQIAKETNCSERLVRWYMDKYQIPRRERSLAIKLNLPSTVYKKGYANPFKGEKRPEMQGQNHPFYGKYHTDITKRKISKSRRGKCIGREHPKWNNGISSLSEKIRRTLEYRQWRSDVFTRDDFTCQECDRRGVFLNAHHKKSLIDIIILNDIRTVKEARRCQELWNINNGITLCEQCHDLTKNGRKPIWHK